MIDDITAELYRVPLARPWGADVGCNYVIRSEIRTSDGRRGHGFTWLPQIGPRAAHSLVVHECRELLRGGPLEPSVVWDHLWLHLHEAGPGGLTTIAMAAIDTALWDLHLSSLDTNLPDLLGARRSAVDSYGSGVNYHYGLDELTAQAGRWVADGYGAVKIKVGRPNLDEDVERVAVVRQVIGPDRRLMVDANQRWDLPTAERAISRLAPFDLTWVEEPLLADDTVGYVALRSVVGTPIAVGENHYTTYQFGDLLARGACDIVQPDVARVGGITPFLRIAEMAASFGVRVQPHHLPEISAQLALCLADPPMVEVVEDASFEALGLLTTPGCVVRDRHTYRFVGGTGLGMHIDAGPLERLDR